MLPIFSQLNDEAQEALYDQIRDLDSRYSKTKDSSLGQLAYVGGGRVNSDNSIVFSLNGKLYNLNGYYSSYEGTEWEGLDSVFEVKAESKTITVYNKV